MADDFGAFDDELRELELEDAPDMHSMDDIETVLATMRHLPEHELQQIRENLMRSMPPHKVLQQDDPDLTSNEMLMLNAFTFVMFILFGKTSEIVLTKRCVCGRWSIARFTRKR